MTAIRTAAAGALLTILACSHCACSSAGMGYFFGNMFPDTKKEAKYKPPKDKKVLTLVETRLVDTSVPLGRTLTERLNEELRKNHIAKSTVPYPDLQRKAAATPRFADLKPSEIGKLLGAEIVCYVVVEEFRLKDDVSIVWEGRLRASVSLIDVATDEQLWPQNTVRGKTVGPITTPMKPHESPDYGEVICRELCTEMADRTAKLFYDHDVPDLDPEDRQMPQPGFVGY